MFSIIIPVYNVAPYLRQCLDSVLGQTVHEWEAICVDDGATDGSAGILDEYAAGDGRIRVMHQSNSGVSSARNVGLEAARGEWISFLDSDDVLNRHMLENCRQAIAFGRENDVEAVVGQVEKFSECRWGSIDVRGNAELCCHDAHDCIDESLCGCGIWHFCFRRDLVGGLRFDPGIKFGMGEDTVFVKRMLDRVGNIVFTSGLFYGYRQRDGSAMHSGLTAEKLSNLYHSYFLRAKTIDESRKSYCREEIRCLGFQITEYAAFDIMNKLSAKDREEAFKNWRKLLREVSRFRIFTGWTQFVIFIVTMFPVRPVELLLCYVPHWLKTKGVHR